MEEMGYTPSTQSKFNYAGSILQRIDFLQIKAADKYREGDIPGWFYELKEIKFQIVGRMSQEEGKAFLNLEIKINNFLEKRRTNNKYNMISIRLIEIYLSKIQKKIEEWGMGLVNQKDDTLFT